MGNLKQTSRTGRIIFKMRFTLILSLLAVAAVARRRSGRGRSSRRDRSSRDRGDRIEPNFPDIPDIPDLPDIPDIPDFDDKFPDGFSPRDDDSFIPDFFKARKAHCEDVLDDSNYLDAMVRTNCGRNYLKADVKGLAPGEIATMRFVQSCN